MKTVFIEVEHTLNWGKFIVGRFDDEERSRPSTISHLKGSLLSQRGWGEDHVLVMDIETGEGAWFLPGGCAKADLDKHRIWVCPMFEPFLKWLYRQDLSDLDKLPRMVKMDDSIPGSFLGYRRDGVSH